MNFRNYADLAALIARWQDDLPQDVEVICGVPRSGLMVAHLLALTRNLPVTDVDGLLAGRLIGGGKRLGMDARQVSTYLQARRRILVVEDSVLEGNALNAVREALRPLAARHDLTFCAAYVSPEGRRLVDHAGETVPRPRLFEWNIFHNRFLASACLDIDGVLCRDPAEDENDDGERYLRFIREVAPRYRPTVEVGWLVTSRLEKYRAPTEDWLRRHGIRYRQLRMLDLPTKQDRQGTDKAARFKADEYLASGAALFIESSDSQAQTIAVRAGRFVLATDTMILHGPAGLAGAMLHRRNVIRYGGMALLRRIKRKALRLLGGGSQTKSGRPRTP